MSFDSVKKFLDERGFADRAMEFAVSSATVEKAAEAIGCEGKEIAKTMAFKVDENAVLVVMAGDARIDNRKFKDTFATKAVMLKGDEVEEMTGHPIGGVCPFDVKDGAPVYLDVSLKRFDTVYPACGSANSAVKLSVDELEKVSGACGWVDIGKDWE